MSVQGHIRKRVHTTTSGTKTVNWYVVVDVPRTAEGRRRQKWHGGFRTRGEAEAARAAIVAGVHDGSYIEPNRLTVAEWIHGEWTAVLVGRVKPTTAASYLANLNHHVLPRLGRRRLQSVAAADLNSLYADLLHRGRVDGKGGLHPRTVRNVHMLIHLMLADACDAGLVERNVAEVARPPRRSVAPAHPMRSWEIAELTGFLAGIEGDHLEAAWHLAALTGMRRGEVVALRWRHIDFDTARIHVAESRTRVSTKTILSTPKNRRGRTIDLDPSTLDRLRSHRNRQHQRLIATGTLNAEDLVFLYSDGRPLRPDYLSERFLQLSKTLGLRRIRFHDLRHTHATIALRAGIPVKVVSERLGHATPTITLTVYAHVMPGMQADAAQRVAELVLEPTPTHGSFDTRLTPSRPRPPRRNAPLSHSAQWRPKSTYTEEKPETQLEVPRGPPERPHDVGGLPSLAAPCPVPNSSSNGLSP